MDENPMTFDPNVNAIVEKNYADENIRGQFHIMLTRIFLLHRSFKRKKIVKQ